MIIFGNRGTFSCRFIWIQELSIISEAAEEHDQDGEPASKRQKVAYDSNVALTTALVQGLPVMLNDEGTMNALQTHYAELAAQQQITDGSALSGAIAIPIQVSEKFMVILGPTYKRKLRWGHKGIIT